MAVSASRATELEAVERDTVEFEVAAGFEMVAAFKSVQEMAAKTDQNAAWRP